MREFNFSSEPNHCFWSYLGSYRRGKERSLSGISHEKRITLDSKRNLCAFIAGSRMTICGEIHHYALCAHIPHRLLCKLIS